jgi:hypothetical protein
MQMSWLLQTPTTFVKKFKPGNKMYIYTRADIMTVANTYYIREEIQAR